VGRRQVFDWVSEFKGGVTSGEGDEHSVCCLRAKEMKMWTKGRGHVIGNRGISVREVADILGISFGVVERLLKRQTICNVELGGLLSTSPTYSPDLAAGDFLSSQ
jgi:hypothetical protein